MSGCVLVRAEGGDTPHHVEALGTDEYEYVPVRQVSFAAGRLVHTVATTRVTPWGRRHTVISEGSVVLLCCTRRVGPA